MPLECYKEARAKPSVQCSKKRREKVGGQLFFSFGLAQLVDTRHGLIFSNVILPTCTFLAMKVISSSYCRYFKT